MFYSAHFLKENPSYGMYRDYDMFEDQNGEIYLKAYDRIADCIYYRLTPLPLSKWHAFRFDGHIICGEKFRGLPLLVKLADYIKYNKYWSEGFNHDLQKRSAV